VLPLKDNVPTRSFPVVTVGLIVVNVLVFLWEESGKGLNAHVYSWGYYPSAIDGPCVGPATHHHEVVATIFTSMFMHGGIVHIGGFLFGISTVQLVKKRPPLQPVVRHAWR
jgi:membrane associated rhomboid family serine protease